MLHSVTKVKYLEKIHITMRWSDTKNYTCKLYSKIWPQIIQCYNIITIHDQCKINRWQFSIYSLKLFYIQTQMSLLKLPIRQKYSQWCSFTVFLNYTQMNYWVKNNMDAKKCENWIMVLLNGRSSKDRNCIEIRFNLIQFDLYGIRCITYKQFYVCSSNRVLVKEM